MKRPAFNSILVTLVIVVLVVGVVGLLVFIKNQPAPVRGVAPIANIAPVEPDSAKWGLNYPNQYSTLLMTEKNNTRTAFGGSQPYNKLEADARLVKIFAGNAFSKEYKDDRGHANAVTDVRATQRLAPTSPATCYSCKSSDNPKLWSEMGMSKYDAMKFTEMTAQITHSIGCANCHEANTMRLIVTNPALDEALKSQGKDWQTFSRQEMRSLVCANCHVEYYFVGDNKYLTLPWKNGTTVDAIEKYYDEVKFSDWKNPDSGTDLIKMQHPDYEMYTAGSTHYKAGVACADCHMPYTRDASAKFSSHDVMSPLLQPGKTCAACHTDVNYVVERVGVIQKQVNDTMLATEDAIIDAINAITKAAANTSADAALLTEARTLHRHAQLRWDYIAAENSMGFHNPEEALRILASATDLARQSQIKAIQAGSK
jgi:nitrite reductase (cytochrome c-552)